MAAVVARRDLQIVRQQSLALYGAIPTRKLSAKRLKAAHLAGSSALTPLAWSALAVCRMGLEMSKRACHMTLMRMRLVSYLHAARERSTVCAIGWGLTYMACTFLTEPPSQLRLLICFKTKVLQGWHANTAGPQPLDALLMPVLRLPAFQSGRQRSTCSMLTQSVRETIYGRGITGAATQASAGRLGPVGVVRQAAAMWPVHNQSSMGCCSPNALAFLLATTARTGHHAFA